MGKINLKKKYDEGLLNFENAQTIADYQHTLNLFSELLNYADELPTYPRFYSMLLMAKCFMKVGQKSKAEKVFINLIQIIPPESLDNQDFIVDSKLKLAEILCETGRYEEGIKYYHASLSFFHKNNDWYTEAKIHLLVAESYQNHNQYKLAINELNTAWVILEQHESTEIHLTVLFTLGHYYLLGGDQHSAIKWEEMALFVANSLGDTKTKMTLIKNLAGFTFNVQDYKRAIHYNERKLQEARKSSNTEEIKQSLTFLGVCYTETGQSKKGVKYFDEVLTLFSSVEKKDSSLAGMCMVMKAQTCLDMKQYVESKKLLDQARKFLEKSSDFYEILIKLEKQIFRETKSPLVLDCTHRILKIVIAGSTLNIMHSNPQPSINLSNFYNHNSDLNENDRIYLGHIHKVLQSDLFQIKYSKSNNQSMPGAFSMPLKFEYTDDVEVFVLKWSSFKRELAYNKKCLALQTQWDQIKNKITFSEGRIFQNDLEELILYLQSLSQITELFAEIGNRQQLLEVALHISDFLEMETNDPIIAALLWPIRWRLLIAAHSVTMSECHELIEVEILRSFNQLMEVFGLLDSAGRQFVLQFILSSWFNAANTIFGKDGYARLLQIVTDHNDSLEPVDQIRYGIALGEVKSPSDGLHYIEKVLEETRVENPNVPIILAPEFEIAIAILRFKSVAPSELACEMQYGLFAPYIHDEVSNWSDDIFPSLKQNVVAPRPEILAFTDKNLVVLDTRFKDSFYIATLMHEMQHKLRRAGQQLCTDKGDWLLVKRDVPIASALTYFYILKDYPSDNNIPDQTINNIQYLLNDGKTFADAHPEEAKRHINNMLQYFEDLGRQESSASYPCAAILLGMAYSFLENSKSVMSYLEHLEVMDHDEALIYGSRMAVLRI